MNSPKTKKKERAASYAEATTRLDEILALLESTDRVDVDHLAARVEEAAELIRYCRDRLRETETTVTHIVDELAAAAPTPAEAESAAEEEEELPF